MEVAKLWASIGADTSALENGLKRAEGGLRDLAGQATRLAGVVAGALGGAQIIAGAMELDRSLSNIRAVTGKTAEEMGALRLQLEGVAANSAIVGGTQAIADAYYDVVGGVADASTHMAILDAAVRTSEAGQADLSATTSGLIAVMNSYGFSAGQASMVSDVLTRTVGVGVGTMDEFVGAINPIAGLMASVGVSFDDVGAQMAFMSTKGFSASASATRLQAAVTAVIKPNKEMADALKKVGVESGTALIKQYGLAGALNKLKGAVGGSDDAMAAMLGTTEALGASMALTAGDGAEFTEFTQKFSEGLKGATDAARGLQLESISAQFENLKNRIGAVANEVGTAILTVIFEAPKLLMQLVKDLGIDKVFAEVGKTINDLAGPLISTVGNLIRSVWDAIASPGAMATVKLDIPAPEVDLGAPKIDPKYGEDATYAINSTVSYALARDPIGTRISNAIAGALPAVQTALSDLGSKIGGALVKMLNLDPATVQSIETIGKGLLTPFTDALSNLGDINWGNIVLVAGGVFAFAGGISGLQFALNAFKGMATLWLATEVLKVLSNAVDAAKLGGLGEGLKKFGEGLLSIPVEGAKALGDALGIDVEGGLASWRTIFEVQIPAMIAGAVKLIYDFVNEVSGGLQRIGQDVGKFFTDKYVTLLQMQALIAKGLGDDATANWAATMAVDLGNASKSAGEISKAEYPQWVKETLKLPDAITKAAEEVAKIEPPTVARTGGGAGIGGEEGTIAIPVKMAIDAAAGRDDTLKAVADMQAQIDAAAKSFSVFDAAPTVVEVGKVTAAVKDVQNITTEMATAGQLDNWLKTEGAVTAMGNVTTAATTTKDTLVAMPGQFYTPWAGVFGTEGLMMADVNTLLGESGAIVSGGQNAASALSAAFSNVAPTVGGAFAGVGSAMVRPFAAAVKRIGEILGAVGKTNPFLSGLSVAGAQIVAAAEGAMGEIEARETGGPVSANRKYLVGERGPELFIPGRSGYIAPNRALDSGGVIHSTNILKLDGEVVYAAMEKQKRVKNKR